MNVSHRVKHVWWATSRCGSRAVSEVLKHYDFFNYELAPTFCGESDISANPHTHSYDVPKECSDYDIIMQIRNPYSRAVSFWHLFCFKEIDNDLVVTKSFEEYILQQDAIVLDRCEEAAKKYKPKHYIRYEHLQEDIKKIPFIDLNNPKVKASYDINIINNQYKYEGVDDPRGDIRRSATDNRYANWRSFYACDKRLADMVYNSYKTQFEYFGYKKDSWKP